MKWFRHLIRLPDNIPSNITLKYLNEETKRPRSRQRLTTKKNDGKTLKRLQFELGFSNTKCYREH